MNIFMLSIFDEKVLLKLVYPIRFARMGRISPICLKINFTIIGISNERLLVIIFLLNTHHTKKSAYKNKCYLNSLLLYSNFGVYGIEFHFFNLQKNVF